MTKCSEGCTPTCQHCIHAECEQLELDGKMFNGEAIKCKIHSDRKIDAAYWCDDFYCFRADKQQNTTITSIPIREEDKKWMNQTAWTSMRITE